MDPLLRKVLSGCDLPDSTAVLREALVAVARYARTLEGCMQTPVQHSSQSPTTIASSPSTAHLSGDVPRASERPFEEEDFEEALADNLRRSLILTDAKDRFIGSSSSVGLFDVTAQELNELDPNGLAGRRGGMGIKQYLRPEFWSVHPWEQAPPADNRPFDFPEPGLLNELVQLYFTNCNILIPLLHRPTVEKWIKDGQHLSDSGIGGVIIGVCALGSRFSDDPRVILEGTDSLHSSGFKYFQQMRLFQGSCLRAPSLYDMQASCLAILYLIGSSVPEKCWYLVGFGIRAAQDIGLNRKGATEKPAVEKELRKRVFWALFVADSLLSATIGRPSSIDLKDVDVDLPAECDDEYWEHPDPELAFKQPPGIPSRVSCFLSLIKLVQIHYTAARAFYSARRPDPPPSVSAEERDRTTLAEIDSALNVWLDALPEHLRWDSRQPEGRFVNQSAVISALYHHMQILLHRPFVASRSHPSLALSSLAICTNAARACIRIAESHARREQMPTPHIHVALFSSGLVLILNIWRARRTESAMIDEVREMKNVYTCIQVLKTFERRWHSAGRFCDLLTAMVSIGGFSESAFSRPTKRTHDVLTAGDSNSRSAEEEVVRSSGSKHDYLGLLLDSDSIGRAIPVQAGENPGTAHVSAETGPSTLVAAKSGPEMQHRFPVCPGDQANSNRTWMRQLDEVTDNRLRHVLDVLCPESRFSQPLTGQPVFGSNSSMGSSYQGAPMSEMAGGDLLDLPAAALWTGVPTTYDLDDWGQYFSNAEALNNAAPNYSTSFEALDGFDLSGLSGQSPVRTYSAQQREQHEEAFPFQW